MNSIAVSNKLTLSCASPALAKSAKPTRKISSRAGACLPTRLSIGLPRSVPVRMKAMRSWQPTPYIRGSTLRPVAPSHHVLG
jgi:hypothetical protein